MDYERVFGGLGVFLVAIIALMAPVAHWNSAYGVSVGGGEENTTMSRIINLTSVTLGSTSLDMANSTTVESGATDQDANGNLVSRSLNVITSLPTLLGLVPALFEDVALILGVPSAYTNVAVWIFTFAFVILFAYLLLLGLRRLV